MATDMGERKREAVKYLKKYDISKCLEKLLNTVANETPDDIFGYMSEFFAGLAKSPIISRVTATETFSPRGYSSFKVCIEGLVHGNVQDLSSVAAPMDNKPLPEIKPAKGKTPVPGSDIKILKTTAEDGPMLLEAKSEIDQVQSMIDNINKDINTALVGRKLLEQAVIDRVLEDIIATRAHNDEAPTNGNEKPPSGDESSPNEELELQEDVWSPSVHLDSLTVSLAVARSANCLKPGQLYRHFYNVINNKELTSLCLPTPMIAVLSGGKSRSGKLYLIKDVMIFSKHDVCPLQALKQLTHVYQQLEMIVHQKTPASMTAENGALAPPVDKPEQALDFVREAIVSAGLAQDNDVSIALRCSTADLYDKDKQKYEICANTFKSGDELVNIYGDLCERYPEIKMIIDPLVAEDRESWERLNEKMSGNCFLINEHSFSNKRNLLKSVLSDKLVSGNVIRMQDSSTVTQFLEQAKNIEGHRRIQLLSPNEVENNDDYVVDAAVATEADFVIFGGPGRSEHVQKYNRLFEIERDLKASNIFVQRSELVPSVVSSVDDKLKGDHAT